MTAGRIPEGWVRVQLALPAELAEWLEAEADRRVVGERLLVAAAVRTLRALILAGEDGPEGLVVGLPAAPRGAPTP